MLLVLLMLCGQAALAAHQAMHSSSAESTACVTCLAMGSGGAVVCNNEPCACSGFNPVLTASIGWLPALESFVPLGTIRAPPPTIC